MYSLFLLSSLLASSTPVNTGADAQLDKCLATAQGISAVGGCYKDALARVDASISKQIASLPGRLRAGGVSPVALSNGEAAWTVYRDKWCAYEEAAERDVEARPTTNLQCRVEISQDHLARLKQAY